MILEINGKNLTENRYVSAVLMAFGIIGLSGISVLLMTFCGESMAYLFPQLFERGVFLENLPGMFSGGIVALLGFLVLFGRKGCSVAINTSDNRSQDYTEER